MPQRPRLNRYNWEGVYSAEFTLDSFRRRCRQLAEILIAHNWNCLIAQDTRFMAGQYDTRFVEERFSMDETEESRQNYAEIAAILATMVAHREAERSAQIVQRNERDTSNWKWVGRWERMHR